MVIATTFYNFYQLHFVTNKIQTTLNAEQIFSLTYYSAISS